jgi:hypothetical protein
MTLTAPHETRPRWNLDKAQEWLIGQVPGIGAEARVTLLHQGIASCHMLAGIQMG